jgi:hypothetical protein
LHAGSLGFQPAPLGEQLPMQRRQKIAQAFDVAAVGGEFAVELRIDAGRGQRFKAQGSARLQ